MCVQRDNVSATLYHMHRAVRYHSPELLVKMHDNHPTTLLLTEKKFSQTGCYCLCIISFSSCHIWRTAL